MFNPRSIRRSEYGKGKNRLIISVAEVEPGKFEAITMQPHGDELELFQSRNERDAVEVFAQMVERYGSTADRASLSPQMRELVAALELAAKAAQEAREANSEDGGTCNRDAPALDLPGWKLPDVELCARVAGTTVFEWRPFKRRLWVFGVPGPTGQGNLRSRMAEAMTRSLEASGFAALEFCQMD